MTNNLVGLDLIHQTEAYDYDWNIFSIFLEAETGLYYWVAEAGCSCSGPLEDITKADLTRGTKQELIAAFKSWLGPDEAPSWSLKPQGEDRLRELEKVHTL